MKKFQLKTFIFLFILILVYSRNLRKVIIMEHFGEKDEFYVNDKYLDFDISLKRFNRFTVAFNLTYEIKTNIDFPMTTAVKLLKLNNNEYKETAISFRKDLCEYLSLVNSFLKDKSFTYIECPLRKGNYYVSNITLDDLNEKMAGLLPLWHGKIVIDVTRTNDSLSVVRLAVYGRVEQV